MWVGRHAATTAHGHSLRALWPRGAIGSRPAGVHLSALSNHALAATVGPGAVSTGHAVGIDSASLADRSSAAGPTAYSHRTSTAGTASWRWRPVGDRLCVVVAVGSSRWVVAFVLAVRPVVTMMIARLRLTTGAHMAAAILTTGRCGGRCTIWTAWHLNKNMKVRK